MATLVAPIVRKKRADDIFFTMMSVVQLTIVVVGFAPSYFLRGAVFAPLPSLVVHLHGAVFSSWIFLFVIQSSLVSAGNIRLHRKLGVLGAVIAGLMVILGILAPFGTIRRAAHLPSFFTPESFLVGNVFGIIVFGAYVAFAIWKRNNRIVHKRMMLMANAMLMSPALARMAFPVTSNGFAATIPFMAHHPFLIGVIPLAMIVALFIFDLLTQRRVLAVTLIGGILFWATDPVSDWIIARPFSHQLVLWAQHHP
ncbi:hypothetical protein HDF16_002534 [Granulicella aggregans]|uniref:Uncharacterized protein n=1 Tax=Granulicella aggregans TaxID=474949 RepID=A0A7W8E3C2_9BACT|nr:hypothetical protein [Granulicella aggregans]MBB5057828.1 hypothetical protein [Granulicella aggregans]